jgi:hypothetical protein
MGDAVLELLHSVWAGEYEEVLPPPALVTCQYNSSPPRAPAGDRDFAKQPRRPVIRDLLRIDQVNGRSLVCFRTATRRNLSFTWIPEPHLPNPQAADRFGFCA